MKLAVLADIHANLAALETVIAHVEAWQPDMVVVDGDTVNRGPRPNEALALVQQRQSASGWQVVRGNHEDYVIHAAQAQAAISDEEFEIYRSAYWTSQQLGTVAPLEAMPDQVEFQDPAGQRVLVVHASVRNNRDGIFPKNSDEQLRAKVFASDQPQPILFCTGHTHWPLIRHLDNTLVVNVGSVGLPFDGDYRASYAQLVWRDDQWRASIIRLDYDRQRTERDFFETGYLAEGGPLVTLILDELRIARPHLFHWTQEYHERVIAGEIDIEQAVDQFLEKRHAELK